MKRFKTLVSLALAATLAIGITACSAPKEETAPATDPATEEAATGEAATEEPAAEPMAEGEEVTLNLWLWDNSIEEQYKLMIADFESKNPGIKIKYTIAPWADYWTKLQTALPTGEGPDIFWLNHPNSLTYMPSGHLKDLTPMNLDQTHFNENLVKPFTMDGKTYGVPIFYDTIVMFYNKTLFDEAGVAYPQRGWTWDEMRETAKKLTKMSGEETSQYGISFTSGVQGGSLEFVKQNGGKVFSDDRMKIELDNPEAKEAFQFLLDLKYKDKTALTGSEFLTMNPQGELFMNNMVAMEVNGMWRVKQYHDQLGDKVGITHLPKQKVEANTFHNIAYAAAEKSKHPEAVQKFMEYASTKEHGDFVANVFLPAYNESQAKWFETYPDLDLKVFAEAVEYAFPLQIAAKNSGSVFPVLEKQLELVFEKPEVGTSLTELDAAVNAEINK